MELHPPMFFWPICLTNLLKGMHQTKVKTVIRDSDEMTILKHCKTFGKKRRNLLDPDGVLGERVPSLSIKAANMKVPKLIAGQPLGILK